MVIRSVPAPHSTPKVMVMLPAGIRDGITARTGAPAKVSSSAGLARLVARVRISRWRPENRLSSPVGASSWNGRRGQRRPAGLMLHAVVPLVAAILAGAGASDSAKTV